MGKPRGSAFNFSTPDETNPKVAAWMVAALQNDLLEIAVMNASSVTVQR
jgi:hypothetical protein